VEEEHQGVIPHSLVVTDDREAAPSGLSTAAANLARPSHDGARVRLAVAAARRRGSGVAARAVLRAPVQGFFMVCGGLQWPGHARPLVAIGSQRRRPWRNQLRKPEGAAQTVDHGATAVEANGNYKGARWKGNDNGKGAASTAMEELGARARHREVGRGGERQRERGRRGLLGRVVMEEQGARRRVARS